MQSYKSDMGKNNTLVSDQRYDEFREIWTLKCDKKKKSLFILVAKMWANYS